VTGFRLVSNEGLGKEGVKPGKNDAGVATDSIFRILAVVYHLRGIYWYEDTYVAGMRTHIEQYADTYIAV
jgi:hypothetical protein